MGASAPGLQPRGWWAASRAEHLEEAIREELMPSLGARPSSRTTWSGPESRLRMRFEPQAGCVSRGAGARARRRSTAPGLDRSPLRRQRSVSAPDIHGRHQRAGPHGPLAHDAPRDRSRALQPLHVDLQHVLCPDGAIAVDTEERPGDRLRPLQGLHDLRRRSARPTPSARSLNREAARSRRGCEEATP